MSNNSFSVSRDRFYNHGCEDAATFELSADGLTAVCVDATNCHKCWQCGHDANHIYFNVGDTIEMINLKDVGELETEDLLCLLEIYQGLYIDSAKTGGDHEIIVENIVYVVESMFENSFVANYTPRF